MKRIGYAFLSVLTLLPLGVSASVTADFYTATDTAAQSSFSGSLFISGFLGAGTSTQYRTSEPWEFLSQTTGSLGGSAIVTNYDTSAPFAGLTIRGSRGSQVSPSAIQTGNTLGQVGFSGFDGNSFPASSAAALRGIAQQNWSSTARGSALTFQVTPNNSTSRVEKMRLTNSGQLLIGSTTSWSNNILAVDGDIASTGSLNPKGDVNVNDGSIHIGNPFLSGGKLTVEGDALIVGGVVVKTTSGTSTITIDSDGGSSGGCLKMKDSDGSGYTFITVNNGSISLSTTSCS